MRICESQNTTIRPALRAIVLHAVADEDDSRAAALVIGADLREHGLAAARVKPRRRLVEDEHLRLHRNHARDGHAALLSAGELKGRLGEHVLAQADQAPPPRARGGRSRLSKGPCCPGRRRCPYRPSPQRADTPDTGTPAPPRSARRRIFFGSAQMSRPSSRMRPAVGRSRPLRCWINVDLPDPVWPMTPRNSPGATVQIHPVRRRGARRASRRCRYGSGSLSSKSVPMAYFPSAPSNAWQMAPAHIPPRRWRPAADPSPPDSAHTAAPPCPAR